MEIDFSKVIMVRDRRLEKSRLRETESSVYCESARRVLMESKQEMTDYASEIQHLEVRLISQLMERRVTVHDIYAIEAELKRAEAKAKALVDQHTAAKKQLEGAELHLSELRKERVARQRRVQKIKELDAHISRSKARRLISTEENEMDEFVELMAGRRPINA